MKVKRIGESYWAATQEWTLEFTHLREHSDGMTAEVTAGSLATGQSYWGRVNLAAPHSRATFAKAAEQTVGGEWRAILDATCWAVVKAERTGEPAVALVAAPPDPARWLVPGLFVLHETNLLFGDGGTAKSTFALALALAGLTGTPITGDARWSVAPLRAVLYLDWESQAKEHIGRLWALTEYRQAPPTTVYYRKMPRPLTEMMGAIHAEVARLSIDLVIVDSMIPASGFEPEGADAATRTMNALHTLPTTRLVLSHINQRAVEAARTGAAGARPYGSVFVRNLSRACVEARTAASEAEDEPGEFETHLTVSYRHDKLNSGPLLPPTAIRWVYDRQTRCITPRPGTVALTHLGVPQRLLHALAAGDKTTTDLADELEITPMVARVRLNEMESVQKVVRIGDAGGGRGRKTLWGLPDTKRTDNGG